MVFVVRGLVRLAKVVPLNYSSIYYNNNFIFNHKIGKLLNDLKLNDYCSTLNEH